MGMFDAFNISASGMTAQRYRMDIISENLANIDTTRTADGTPYRRKVVTFEERSDHTSFSSVLGRATKDYVGQGVNVTGVHEDTWNEMIKAYDPSHPDADENGYVWYPNVNTVTEMPDLIDASRSFEANATAFQASKSMAMKALEIGKG